MADLAAAYLALFESEGREPPARGHLVWCRGCGALWTEPPDPRPGGPDPEDDSCACTCTDDTAPHYEDWYPVRLPGTGPRRAGGPEEAQDG